MFNFYMKLNCITFLTFSESIQPNSLINKFKKFEFNSIYYELISYRLTQLVS